MCNCKETVVDELKKLYPDSESIEILGVEMLSGKTYSEVEIKLKNKKRPKVVNLLHSYCPHCGEKYSEGVEE